MNMDKQGVYLQLYKRAPAPNRDYYGLTITKTEVVLNIWNITHGPHVFPKKQRCPLEDFYEDKMMKIDVERLFGKHVLDYCQMLSQGHPKLQCMPTKVFLYILRHLATNDILNLGQTSKIFFELFNRESTWKLLFRKRSKKRITRDDIECAAVRGWRNALMTKILLQEPAKSKTNLKPVKKPKAKPEKPAKSTYKINIKEEAPSKLTLLNKSEIMKTALVPKEKKIAMKSKPAEDTRKTGSAVIHPKKSTPDNTLKTATIPKKSIQDDKIKTVTIPRPSIQENTIINKLKTHSLLTFPKKLMQDDKKPRTATMPRKSAPAPKSANPFRIHDSFYEIPDFGKPGVSLKPFTIPRNKPQSANNLNNAKIINECKDSINNKLNLVKSKSNVNVINNVGVSGDSKTTNVTKLKQNNIDGEVKTKNVNLKSGLKSGVAKKNVNVKFK